MKKLLQMIIVGAALSSSTLGFGEQITIESNTLVSCSVGKFTVLVKEFSVSPFREENLYGFVISNVSEVFGGVTYYPGMIVASYRVDPQLSSGQGGTTWYEFKHKDGFLFSIGVRGYDKPLGHYSIRAFSNMPEGLSIMEENATCNIPISVDDKSVFGLVKSRGKR